MALSPADNSLPIKSLAAALLASCAMGTLAAVVLRLMSASSVDGASAVDVDMFKAALMGPASILVAGSLGLAAFFAVGRDDRRKLPGAIMACSGIRMFVGLGLGYGLYVSMGLPKAPFWQSFLVAGVLVLVVESLIMNRFLPRHAGQVFSTSGQDESSGGSTGGSVAAGETVR